MSSASGKRRASPSRTPKSSGRRSKSSGHDIDAQLLAGDVRLTMGGEPTFVSVDDPDGAEWNTTAMGPDKRRARRSSSTTASSRSTRRRACRTSARASGIRASSCRAGRSTASGAATASRSGRIRSCSTTRKRIAASRAGVAGVFLAGVAERLGLPPEHVFAAFEDAFYYLWRERRLPANVDPFKSKLERPAGARAAGEGVRAGSRHGRRSRAARVARTRRRCAGSTGAWFLRARALLPDSGRFAARLPAAARFDAVGREGRLPVHSCTPDPMAPPRRCRAAAEIRRQSARDAGRSCRRSGG